MPTNRPFKRGDILEIVRAEIWWPAYKNWIGRLVVVSNIKEKVYTFRWIFGAPEEWHNSELFVLEESDFTGPGKQKMFKKVGRAKL